MKRAILPAATSDWYVITYVTGVPKFEGIERLQFKTESGLFASWGFSVMAVINLFKAICK